MKRAKSLLVLFSAIQLFGCVSIPPEAPQLSVEIGKRISAIEDSNITLLHRFFDRKKQDVDEFIQNQWVPEFAKNVFSEPIIAQAWETIVSENNKEDRLKLFVRLGPKLQKKINSKRLELIKPLEDLERSIESSIRSEYSQVKVMNSSITSFLLSASEVADNRSRLLESAGVTQSKINELVNDTDAAVTSLVTVSKDAQDKVERGEEFLAKIQSMKESVKD